MLTHSRRHIGLACVTSGIGEAPDTLFIYNTDLDLIGLDSTGAELSHRYDIGCDGDDSQLYKLIDDVPDFHFIPYMCSAYKELSQRISEQEYYLVVAVSKHVESSLFLSSTLVRVPVSRKKVSSTSPNPKKHIGCFPQG